MYHKITDVLYLTEIDTLVFNISETFSHLVPFVLVMVQILFVFFSFVLTKFDENLLAHITFCKFFFNIVQSQWMDEKAAIFHGYLKHCSLNTLRCFTNCFKTMAKTITIFMTQAKGPLPKTYYTKRKQ